MAKHKTDQKADEKSTTLTLSAEAVALGFRARSAGYLIVEQPGANLHIVSLIGNPNAPEKKLAEGWIEFTDDAPAFLRGTKLEGFAAWFGKNKQGPGFSIYGSVPERTYGQGRRYQMLRDAASDEEQAPGTAVTVRGRRTDDRATNAIMGLMVQGLIEMAGGLPAVGDLCRARLAGEEVAATKTASKSRPGVVVVE